MRLPNALGIPPLLFIGEIADVYGIPRVTFIVALGIVLLAGLNLFWLGSLDRKRADDAAITHHP